MLSCIADSTQEEALAPWILSCHHQGSFQIADGHYCFLLPIGFKVGAGDMA